MQMDRHLCILCCRRRWPAEKDRRGNNSRQTAACSRGHRGTCRVGSSHLTLGLGRHSNLPGTCTDTGRGLRPTRRFSSCSRASPVAGVSGAVVPAAEAAAGGGLALVRVPVAEAAAAGGEAPVARQAALTPPPGRPGHTSALTRQRVAEGVARAPGVAVTRCKRDT